MDTILVIYVLLTKLILTFRNFKLNLVIVISFFTKIYT